MDQAHLTYASEIPAFRKPDRKPLDANDATCFVSPPLTQNIDIKFPNIIITETGAMVLPELKKAYLDMVPEFHGEQELLTNFLEVCDELVLQFYDRTNPANFQNKFLMRSILAKIKGRAAELIISANCSNWESVKNALTSGYSDKRDLYTLTIEISELKQGGDTPFAYLEKTRKFLNLAIMYLKNNAVPNIEQQAQFFKGLALRVFLRGLKEPLGGLLQARRPGDLDAAHNLLTNDFQFCTTKSFLKAEQPSGSSRPPQGPFNFPRHQGPRYAHAGPSSSPRSTPFANQQVGSDKQGSTAPRQGPLQQTNWKPQQSVSPRPSFPTPMSGVQTIRTSMPQFHQRNIEGREEEQIETVDNEIEDRSSDEEPFLDYGQEEYQNSSS